MGHKFGYRFHNAKGASPSPVRVTITHPNHPLTGESLEFLGFHGRRVKLRAPDGRTRRIPTDWTDLVESNNDTTRESTTHLLSIDGLRELVRFFNTRELQRELKLLRAKKRRKCPQVSDREVSDRVSD